MVISTDALSQNCKRCHQDDLAAAGKDPDSVYGKLVNEYVSFFDQQSENWTSALYKSVTDATLYGE